KIPKDAIFKSKEELALDMIERAIKDGIPGEIVLADSFYGRSSDLREILRLYGLDYALGIPASLKMWLADDRESGPQSARDIAEKLGDGAFREITWRQGVTKGDRGKLRARFAFRRVVVADQSASKHVEWLIVEKGDDGVLKFALTTLPRSMKKKELIR